MKVTIVFDDYAWKEGLTADKGFSAVIDAHGKRILFDAGSNGIILLNNLKKLEIDPKSINELFLSHNHFDHIGGLSAFLNHNNDVKIYVPRSLRGIHNAKEVNSIGPESQSLNKNFYTTGEIDKIEQSLVIDTPKGLVILTGCSHPGIEKILERANKFGKPFAMIGGFHDWANYEVLDNLKFVCPTHCSKHRQAISEYFPNKYLVGGVGRVLDTEELS